MTRNHPQDELKEHAPHLSERDVNDPFTVPHGYFDTLPESILQRAKAEATVVALPPRRSAVWFNVAAALAALVLMSIPFLKPGFNNTRTVDAVAMNEISNADLFNYLAEDNTIHVTDIAAGLPDEKLDTMTQELIGLQAAAYEDAAFDIAELDFDEIESM